MMEPRLWCYHVYDGTMIIMSLCLWCHYDYGVTMFVWLQCCDYHGIDLFQDDSICLNVFINKMLNIVCGT